MRWPIVKTCMTMPKTIAIDTSVLVGLINPQDVWHHTAQQLNQALQAGDTAVILFDCVLAEAASVIVRRLHEKKQFTAVDTFLQQLHQQYPAESLTWIFPTVSNFYGDILLLMRSTNGTLNFIDALIALACRERSIPTIASFDTDFDTIPWLTRLSQPEQLAKITKHG